MNPQFNLSPYKTLLALACAVATLWTSPTRANDERRGHDDDRNPGSHYAYSPEARVQGKTLTEWLSTYWRWYYGGADPAKVMVGKMMLMPLPSGQQLAGSGTPEDPAILRGQIEVTLTADTPYVLPEFAWTGEHYNDGQPNDQPIPDEAILDGTAPLLTIDGERVITDCNKESFYVRPTAFNPPVIYPTPSSYHSDSAIFFQGVGFVGRPLSVGEHRIKLIEPFIIRTGAIPGFPGFGVVFDNTWIIHVVRGH